MTAENYRSALPHSAELHHRVQQVLAGATGHDSWRLNPFAPIFVSAKGAYKHDVDGRSYVDLWMGHGSLLLGHGDDEVVDALCRQAAQATHLSGLTLPMIEWAEAICALVPSAERVRFTASGSEAAHLAFRVARAFTGRSTIVRLGGHYHGWIENLLTGLVDGRSIGLPEDAGGDIAVMAFDDLDAVEERLSAGDVAAVFIEPGGGGSGALPWSTSFLARLRELTERRRTLLVFDEVISGFRYSPGGVQALAGVRPDLTVLAKIMAGGMPGGALAGLKEVMSVFAGGSKLADGRLPIIHAGTFNGFPPSAAAGLVTLHRARDGVPQRMAEGSAALLCAGVNAAAEARGLDVRMFQNSSTVHVLLGATAAGIEPEPSRESFALIAEQQAAHSELRRQLLIAGIDMHASHGWISQAHCPAVIEDAVARFDRAFEAIVNLGAGAPFVANVCAKTCFNATCACRARVFAGCDLPLADAAGEPTAKA